MPIFQPVPVEEAKRNTAALGRSGRILEEYRGYLDHLRPGLAGKLTPEDGETVTAVRRRIARAAKAAGRQVTVRRTADAVYFWPGDGRGRGRSRKA